MWDEEGIIRSQDVIAENWIDMYKIQRGIIHKELVYLNSLVFFLERIEKFPLTLLFELDGDRAFFRTAHRAIAESVIVGLWRIVFDEDKRALTLAHFKTDIEANLIDNNVHQLVAQSFTTFNTVIASVKPRFMRARHNFLGHMNIGEKVRASQTPYNAALTLFDLKTTLEAASSLFQVLCFETMHSLWIWDYSSNARQSETTDIDRLLDLYANSSVLLHLPEEDPNSWREWRSSLSEEDIVNLNKYRLKFDLPPIETVGD